MNGRNKYWREARWDKNQPARLAHIKEKRSKKHDEGRTGNVSGDSVLEAAGAVPQLRLPRSVAEHSGIGRYTMSARMNGHQPWTSKEIAAICELLDIRQDEIGELFFPEVGKEDETA